MADDGCDDGAGEAIAGEAGVAGAEAAALRGGPRGGKPAPRAKVERRGLPPRRLRADLWRAGLTAERVLDEAQLEAGRVRALALGELEAWRAEAAAAGREEGLREGRAQAAALVLETERRRDQALRQADALVIDLAVALARRITLEALRAEPGSVAAAVGEALRTARGRRRAVVRLHPAGAAALRAQARPAGRGGGAAPRWRWWPIRRSSRPTCWSRASAASSTGGWRSGWRRCAGPWRRRDRRRRRAPAGAGRARSAPGGRAPTRRPWREAADAGTEALAGGRAAEAAPRLGPGAPGGRADAAHRPPHQAGGAGARGGPGRGPARRGLPRWPGRRTRAARSSPRWWRSGRSRPSCSRSARRPAWSWGPRWCPPGAAPGGVGEGLLGRVLDGLGRTIDGPPPEGLTPWPVERRAPPPLARGRIAAPLPVGVRAVDGLLTAGARPADRASSPGPASASRSLLGRSPAAPRSTCGGLPGRRARPRGAGVPRGRARAGDGPARSVVVAATSDAPPLVRLRAGPGGDRASPSGSPRRGGRCCSWSTRSPASPGPSARSGWRPASRRRGRATRPASSRRCPRLLERTGPQARGWITAVYTVLVAGDDHGRADRRRGARPPRRPRRAGAAAGRARPLPGHRRAGQRLPAHGPGGHAGPPGGRGAGARRCWRPGSSSATSGPWGPGGRGADPAADEAVDRWPAIEAFLRQGEGEAEPLEATVARLAALAPGRPP